MDFYSTSYSVDQSEVTILIASGETKWVTLVTWLLHAHDVELVLGDSSKGRHFLDDCASTQRVTQIKEYNPLLEENVSTYFRELKGVGYIKEPSQLES